MTNLRADYWDADGTSLHTWAIHLERTPDRRIGGRKGGNPSPLGIDGDDHRDKPYGPVTFLVAGWVSDRDADGTLPTDPLLRIARREANLDTLEAALRGAGGQVTLTKRRYEDVAGTPTVVPYTREVELVTFDSVAVPSDRRQLAAANWTAELYAADPWWYTSPGGVRDHLG